MHIQEAIRAVIAEVLSAKKGIESPSVQLMVPQEVAHGDYATNVALAYAKQAGTNPRALAEEIAEAVKGVEGIEKVEIAGPGYVNMTLSNAIFGSAMREVLDKNTDWGRGGKQNERWLIEHTSPNPNKAMHLGHLPNNLIGMAIANIATFSGVEVFRDCIDNDRGIAIAKLMWGYVKFARIDGDTTKTHIAYWYDHQDEWQTPESTHLRPDRFVDGLYVKGAGDFEGNIEVEKAVRQMVVDWEAHEQKTWALWERVLQYSHDGQNLTLARLGNHWDQVWHEHEHYAEGKKLVDEGVAKGVFKVGENGAIVTDFSAYNIPDTVVIKSDGTSLYITQDLALTRLKREKFHPDRMFWVIGPEQSMAMKQMFTACEQLGIGKVSDYTHVAYGAVTIKGQGKMSSRKGNVLFIDDLIDLVRDHVREVMQKSDMSEEEKEKVAEQVALGAVKYAFLHMNKERNVDFDIEAAIDIHSDSGPYIQYTYARARSILTAVREAGIAPQAEAPQTDDERFVARTVMQFPDVVARAHAELAPHHVAQYAHELASAYNTWYAKERVVGTPDVARRAALTEAVAITLKNALSLLGIEAPEKM